MVYWYKKVVFKSMFLIIFFIVLVFRKIIWGICKEWVLFVEIDCIICLEYFDDEMVCSSDVICIFVDGVCLFDMFKIDG